MIVPPRPTGAFVHDDPPTQAEPPEAAIDPTLSDLLAGSRRQVIVVDADGEWTRADLISAVTRIADGLRRAGIGEGDRVAVAVRPSFRTVAALLGARAVGALTCPIERPSAAALAALATSHLVAEEPEPGIPALDPRALIGEGGASPPIADGERAWGIPTSGSSGRHKTVVLAQRSVRHVTDVCERAVGYREGDRVLCALPLHHVYGLSQLWLGLRARAVLLLPPGPSLPSALAPWARRATVVPTIPSVLRRLLPEGELPDLRLVTLSGQATGPADRAAFTRALPHASFLQFYGLTEAYRVLWLPAEEFATRLDATGRPLPGMTASLDEAGELWLEGPNVADGYLDDPVLTGERFVEGRLRTGDLFERDGDLYRYLGRLDGVFKSFGEKVVPELIEQVLLEHPGIEACLVEPEPAAGELRPVARAVVREPAPAVSELMRFVRERVPSVMVPVRIDIVPALPRTDAGKIRRRARADR